MKIIYGIVGLVLILGGIAFAIYAGVWWAFVGGIIAIIEGAKANPINAMDIALGIARVFFAGAIGWISFVITVLPGIELCKLALK